MAKRPMHSAFVRPLATAFLIACSAAPTVVHVQPAAAQGRPVPAGTYPRPISVGTPENASAETFSRFFFFESARRVDDAYRAMRAAIARCDRQAYEEALARLTVDANQILASATAVPSIAEVALERAQRDVEAMERDRDRAPPFPENCARGSATQSGPLSLLVVGGAQFPVGRFGNVTGVDTFFGPGNFFVDSTSGGATAATGLAGARGRFYADDAFEEIFRLQRKLDAQPPPRPTPRFFVEAGVQSSFGAQSFIQPFQQVNAVPQGYGSNTINEGFQIPILVGLQVPLTVGQSTSAPIFVDLYGGIALDSWRHTLQGAEAGAPGGPGFFARSNRFTVNPTVGLGVSVPLRGFLADLPGPTFGIATEVQFRPGSVVTATSPNFPSETYYGTINPSANIQVMGRVGFPFGGR